MAKDNHADAANKARSEAAKKQPRTETGFAEKPVDEQCDHPLAKQAKQRQAKATASKTDAANKKRSEAAKGNDNAAKDREEKTVVGQSVHPLIKEAKERKAKADKSKTNAGAVARGEAAKKQPRTETGTFDPVVGQIVPPPKQYGNKLYPHRFHAPPPSKTLQTRNAARRQRNSTKQATQDAGKSLVVQQIVVAPKITVRASQPRRPRARRTRGGGGYTTPAP